MSLLAPRDASWPGQFRQVSGELREAMGEALSEIHHIGSTAVQGVHWSKPVIDVLVVVRNIAELDGSPSARLQALGFEGRGEYGIAGRRYFVRHAGPDRMRTNVHCYEDGDPQVDRHLAFRDHLERHPECATAYSELKRQLAAVHGHDKVAYQAGKAEFIARIARELQGRSSNGSHG
jgi:GrpB-like predicted nucleotidyltransferase (UPF0157 family)